MLPEKSPYLKCLSAISQLKLCIPPIRRVESNGKIMDNLYKKRHKISNYKFLKFECDFLDCPLIRSGRELA
jgi:hypothetical protein